MTSKAPGKSLEPLLPDEWVQEHLSEIRAGGHVLDLACGSGRHSRLLLARGYRVTCVDKDTSDLSDLVDLPSCTVMEADLENGHPWPLDTRFDGILVVNYLHRPLFRSIREALLPGAVLIYRTFMEGHQRLGKPSNPDFLLQPNELREAFSDMEIVSFSQGPCDGPAIKQQICARKIPA